MNWTRAALTDADGEFDVANIGLAVLIVLVLGSIPSLILMVALALYHERPFDPQPLGIAIGAICTGFATALGAFAAYQAATKKHKE